MNSAWMVHAEWHGLWTQGTRKGKKTGLSSWRKEYRGRGRMYEEDKGRFWGEQPLQSLDKNNSLPQNLFCPLRHSIKKKEPWDTLATHFLSFSCGQYTKRVATQHNGSLLSNVKDLLTCWRVHYHWQPQARGEEELLVAQVDRKLPSMKDSLPVKARQHYPCRNRCYFCLHYNFSVLVGKVYAKISQTQNAFCSNFWSLNLSFRTLSHSCRWSHPDNWRPMYQYIKVS